MNNKGGAGIPPPTYSEAMNHQTHYYPQYNNSSASTAPPPPEGYVYASAPPHSSAGGGGSSVIMTTVIPLGPQSTRMTCPTCHAQIDSAVRKEPGIIAYLSSFGLLLLGLWCGCCLIPCCIDGCMDVHHTCPNCKAYLGRFKSL